MSPAPRRLSVPAPPLKRTSTSKGASPCSSRPAGNWRSSRGTRMPRSIVSSPAMIIHSITASATDSAFRATWRKGQIGFIGELTSSRVLDDAGGPPHAALEQQRAELHAQGVGGQTPLNLAVDDDRQTAGFLGHHNGYRIVFFGQPDFCAVAGAKLLAESRVDGQRKEAGRSGDAVLLDNHRSIVKR